MSQDVVIGPMITAYGFRSWFWGCRPSMLVAIPGGFWVVIAVGGASAGLGGLVGVATASKGGSKSNKTISRIKSASDEELAGMPGAVVYRVEDLESIVCKRPLLATNPDFIVTCKGGQRKKYGLGYPLAFEAVANALQELYGDLVQRP